ncbi:MAG: helix-turn-helix transcriptional regulator [Eubacteriales bacterium]|nr:helix-turn-helix transcriptional regulator [Eubacteriales bacterium]
MQFNYTKRLKELRLANSYSQAEIAYILCIRQEQYSKYESGTRELPLHLLIKLCTIYKVSADYVLGLNPKQK